MRGIIFCRVGRFLLQMLLVYTYIWWYNGKKMPICCGLTRQEPEGLAGRPGEDIKEFEER